jgi:hypothetical protein
MNENKKRRLHDISDQSGIRLDSNEILNFLDDYPYLYRSIQASNFMKHNPIVYNPNMKIIDDNFIPLFSFIIEYIEFIFKKFFSNSGIYINNEEYINIDNEELSIYFNSLLLDEDMEFNFSIFNKQLKLSINTFISNFNISNFKISIDCEGNCIEIIIGPGKFDFSDDENNERKIRNLKRIKNIVNNPNFKLLI